MTRTLYIHVGPMKTGTSIVQHVLGRHDDSVIIYPKVGLLKPGSHAGLVYAFIGKNPAGYEPEGNAEQLFGRVADCAGNSDRDLLISSEVLLPSITAPAAWRDLKGFIDSLLGYLGKDVWQVEILFSCREHLERAASAYNQRIKGTASAEHRDPDEFLLGNMRGLEYEPIVRALRETGFKTTALNYHPSATWVERFLAHVGFSEGHQYNIEMRNVSLPPAALVARLAANRVLDTPVQRKKFTKSLRKLRHRHPRSGSIFGFEAIAEAERTFSLDRKFILEELGIALLAPKPGENSFFIAADQLAEIADAAGGFGESGEAILEIARTYLRE